MWQTESDYGTESRVLLAGSFSFYHSNCSAAN